MNLLIIGGTVFLGRHVARAALDRGHAVTLFHRGQHGADLFPEVERVIGDRKTDDIARLAGRTWDAVVDTCGYMPDDVRRSAEFLADRTGCYAFISSISAYREFLEPRTREDAPLAVMPEGAPSDAITGETYGPLKALCEAETERAFPGRALLVRPGLIVGPHDPSDRFTWWPSRVARGGEVLVPGSPEAEWQAIDVRDLAEWTVTALEAERTGPYNAVAPNEPITMSAFLQECGSVVGSDAQFVYVPGEFLAERDFEAGSLNFWHVPDTEPAYRFISNVDASRSIQHGMRFRPLAATVADTLAWDQSRPPDTQRRVGIDPSRESELIAAWKQHARVS